jgi:hypothetical protein
LSYLHVSSGRGGCGFDRVVGDYGDDEHRLVRSAAAAGCQPVSLPSSDRWRRSLQKPRSRRSRFAADEGIENIAVFALSTDPGHPSVLYVTGPDGTYKTTLGGEAFRTGRAPCSARTGDQENSKIQRVARPDLNPRQTTR